MLYNRKRGRGGAGVGWEEGWLEINGLIKLKLRNTKKLLSNTDNDKYSGMVDTANQKLEGLRFFI